MLAERANKVRRHSWSSTNGYKKPKAVISGIGEIKRLYGKNEYQMKHSYDEIALIPILIKL